MAAPSLSGLTALVTTQNDLTNGSAYSAGNPIFSINSGVSDYGNAARLRGVQAGVTVGTARVDINFDLGGNGCIVGMFQLQFDNNAVNQAQNGCLVGWSDGTSTELFSIGGLDLDAEGDPYKYFVLTGGLTPDLSEGTPNLTTLTQAILGLTRNNTSGGTAPAWNFDQVYLVDDLTLLGGEIANPSSILWLKSEIDVLTPALSSNTGSDRQISIPFPLRNQANYFLSEGEFLAFQDDDGIKRRYKAGFFSYVIEPLLASDYQRHAFGALSSPKPFDVEISSSAHASATIEIESYSFVSGGGTVTYRAPVVVAGGADSGFNTVHYIDGSISNRQVSGVSGRTTQLQIDCVPGQDLSAVGFQLGNNAQLALNPSSAGASAIDLTGLTWSTSKEIDNLTTNNITVTIAAGLLFTVASPTTGGGTVTVQQPQIALTAPNFADGVRVFAARQQTFQIQSADINTGTDQITLGADDETGAAFAGQTTSPATLMLLTLADGATIPTTTPQIKSGNLYYVVANSSGVIQISESEGGAAIAFANAGTESGGALLTLKAETELVNAVVSGGGGLSSPLTLPTGAVINVAAQHRPSAASASTLFERQVSWGSDGAAIADTFSATNNPDVTHNSLVGATLTSKSGIQVSVTTDGATVAGLSFDLSGDIQIDANAVTDNSISFPDGYLWMVYVRSTEAGIRFVRNQFEAIDVMDYRFNDGLTIENTAGTTPLTVYGNVEPETAGDSVIAAGTIHIIPFFVASIAVAGGGSGGLTAQQATQLSELYQTLVSAGVFSTAALANAPSGGGSAPTVEQIWANANRTLTGTQATNIAALGTPNTFKADVSGLALEATLTEIKGSTFDTATDSLEAIRDRGDAAWITATVVNVADKTGFSLTTTERTAIATAVEVAIINEGDANQVIDAILQVFNSNLDLPALELTAIAQQVRTELATELTRIDATISSRSTFNPTTDTVSSVTTVTSPVTAGTVSDKTGYSLSDSGIAAIWNRLTSALTTVGSIGKLLVDNINAAIGSRATPADVNVTVDGGFSAADRTLITDTNQQVKADEVKTATTYQRKEAGTETIILSKTINIQGDTVTVTDAP